MGKLRNKAHGIFITGQGIEVTERSERTEELLHSQIKALGRCVKELAEIIEHGILRPDQ